VEKQKQYPVLKTYPLIELGPEQLLSNGKRQAPLFVIAPGFYGFGPQRIAATLEQAFLNVIGGKKVPAIILRTVAPLKPGRYALMCGPNSYEVAVE
jgi:hypothetical protein